MGEWCKERYNKDENNKLEGLHHKLDQVGETRWEGQNFSEVVARQEEEGEEGGSTSDCSADLVCCSLLLKLDIVVGTLNSCVFCVHCGSTIWAYAIWMTCWHWKTVLMVHLVLVICAVTLHLHLRFIDLSVCPMAVDVKPVVYYNSLLMSNCVIVTHRTHSLTLWSPSSCEAQSLPTCCSSHIQTQLVFVYSCIYYNVDVLNSGTGCMEAFTEQPSIWCYHLRTFVCTISKKK